MALRVLRLRHWCPMKKSDVQSPSKTNGDPLVRKREAVVQDRPPALLSILCRPHCWGLAFCTTLVCRAKRVTGDRVRPPVTGVQDFAPSQCPGQLRELVPNKAALQSWLWCGTGWATAARLGHALFPQDSCDFTLWFQACHYRYSSGETQAIAWASPHRNPFQDLNYLCAAVNIWFSHFLSAG